MADASAKLIKSMSVLKLYRDSLRLATHLGSKVRERERGGEEELNLGCSCCASLVVLFPFFRVL